MAYRRTSRNSKIFKDKIIHVPKNGLINLHSAILPDYRGILGTLHAIKDKKNEIGCTLHTIPNSGIDTGEIIEIAKLAVNPQRSLLWNIIQTYPLGAELLSKVLQKIQHHIPVETQKQNLQQGNYFSVPTQNDFEKIKHLGMEIISAKDYQHILTNFVVKSLSKTEEGTLKTMIRKAIKY